MSRAWPILCMDNSFSKKYYEEYGVDAVMNSPLLTGFPCEIGAGKVVDHSNAEWSLSEIEQIELWTAEFRYNGGKAFYELFLSYRNTREKVRCH